MQLIPFSPGDLVISDTHAMMWVGEPKPIVHNRGGTGVLRENADEAFRVAKSATKFPVFRTNEAGAGERAAEYAIGWSVESGDDAPPVKSPYDLSTKRYAVGGGKQSGRYELASALQDDKQTGWTVESLYRVVKAVARKYAGMGLSPNHGVTCAQFVVYCYQAAFLEMRFGHFINKGILDHLLQERSSAKFLKLQSLDKANPLKASLEDVKADYLPVGLRVEPKAVLVSFLLKLLQNPDSGFARVGFLVHKAGKLALWTESQGERVDDVKLETVLQAF